MKGLMLSLANIQPHCFRKHFMFAWVPNPSPLCNSLSVCQNVSNAEISCCLISKDQSDHVSRPLHHTWCGLTKVVLYRHLWRPPLKSPAFDYFMHFLWQLSNKKKQGPTIRSWEDPNPAGSSVLPGRCWLSLGFQLPGHCPGRTENPAGSGSSREQVADPWYQASAPN